MENATLLYDGDPQQFPICITTVSSGLCAAARATFRFQPDWAPLTDLSIDLNFLNDGLWMFAPSAHLGRRAEAIFTPTYRGMVLSVC